MKFWAAIGILVAAATLGAIGYVVLEQYVYANAINLNLKLIAVVTAAMALVAGLVIVALRRKRES